MITVEVLKKVVDQYNGDDSTIKLLGGFNNSVYEFVINNQSFVIKFFCPSQRDKSYIKGELDWIIYLSEKGMKVAKPAFGIEGNYIHEIQRDKGVYYYVLFERVKGQFIDDLGWDNKLIESWGQAMGRLHTLAKNYKVSDDAKIYSWFETDIITTLPSSDKVLIKWRQYIQRLKSLPTDKNCYGIIHNDLHHKNLYFENEEVILFDFGDCEHSWFIYDIAIALYHAIQGYPAVNEGERLEFANRFLKGFLKGYKLENTMEDHWLKELNFFLDYRQLYSYLYLLMHLDRKNIEGKLKNYLENMKYRIEKGIPYLKGFNPQAVI
ncbi:phosphotransferase enzyme family protein [Alkaliphilus serpentinus]|uniref:Phosphotransferase n=1 Tax=Alkaliphilus serpentinus TaxID=1482731 RepID=A0A833M739_9FIRM|nr:phosphotransferase [Alkaliphilus serpentinus]KAB3529418.1 phosphotransferase [Alkaliphilus serpentinus]